MSIQKAFKFRFYPTEEQQAELAKQFGCARFVYNRYLSLRKTVYFATKQTFNYVACANDMAKLKRSDEFPWLKEADSQTLQQSLKDLDRAFQRFFEMVKTKTLPPPGKKPRKDGTQRVPAKGYPVFWSKHDDQSIRYPQRFKLKHATIYLPKVGWVRFVKHRALKGTPKSITVSKTKTGKYFVSIQCEMQVKRIPVQKSGEVGIDLGLKDFIVLSTGEKIAPPNYYRQAERLVEIRQRRVSRKIKGSASRAQGAPEAKLVIAATHEKIASRRLDFHHKLSRQIVDRFGLIAFEDLNIKGMMANHHLAKSIGDAGWSQFVSFTTYKAAWAGGRVEHVDRFYPSSKTCSVCGAKNTELKLSDRVWQCTTCRTIHDRDANASINILKQATLGARESNAVGDTSSAVRRSAPEQVLVVPALRTANQKPKSFRLG